MNAPKCRTSLIHVVCDAQEFLSKVLEELVVARVSATTGLEAGNLNAETQYQFERDTSPTSLGVRFDPLLELYVQRNLESCIHVLDALVKNAFDFGSTE